MISLGISKNERVGALAIAFGSAAIFLFWPGPQEQKEYEIRSSRQAYGRLHVKLRSERKYALEALKAWVKFPLQVYSEDGAPVMRVSKQDWRTFGPRLLDSPVPGPEGSVQPLHRKLLTPGKGRAFRGLGKDAFEIAGLSFVWAEGEQRWFIERVDGVYLAQGGPWHQFLKSCMGYPDYYPLLCNIDNTFAQTYAELRENSRP